MQLVVYLGQMVSPDPTSPIEFWGRKEENHQQKQPQKSQKNRHCTGKSLSKALIYAPTNPQYYDRLFIAHENCKVRIPAEHFVYTNCCFSFVLTFRTILVHNMFIRYCELLKKIYLYGSQSRMYLHQMLQRQGFKI